jgi:PAS domain S-box-containing protein
MFMAHEIIQSLTDKEVFLTSLFEALPGNSILLAIDPPVFTIVAATAVYVKLTGIKKENLIGKGLFDVFPSNPYDPADQGAKNLLNSLSEVLKNKSLHSIARHRFDSKDANGIFTEKYWSFTNSPVLSSDGEVAYIIHTTEEITDQVLAAQKEEAAKSMEKVYKFFMNAPVIIGLLKGDDYIIEMANEGLLNAWAKTGDVIGLPLLTAVPELGSQEFVALLDHVRNTGESFYAYKYPIRLIRQGREEVLYFDFVYKPFYESEYDNKATGVISVGHDVTAQVLANQRIEEAKREVQRQERLYETITSSIPDLIYVFDLNYRFTYANKALLDMWGKSWEQSIGKSLLENGYESWHAEMHEREIDQVAATKQSVRGEVSFPHAVFGKRVYDYIFVPVFNEEGEVEAVAGTTRDITELRLADQAIRESNERFRNLADESPIFVFIIDPHPEASFSYWNRTWLEYTGQSQEQALGRAWDESIHPDDFAIVMEYYTTAFQNRQSYFIPAVRVKRHDGEYRWHAFKGNPRYLADGAFNGYVGVGFDIHEQKQAEEALKRSELLLQNKVAERTVELERTVEELKRSNKNLEEFAYAASHDLKEPIRKIHFFGERIKDTMSDRMSAEEKRYFERIEGASKRMGTLIDDLLSYSQVSIRPHSFEEVDMNKLIDQVLEDLDLEIEDKQATITVDKLFTWQGHQRQLQQAFQNLISNAIKYNKPGVKPELTIKCSSVKGKDMNIQLHAEDREKAFNWITISDNGIGFEQADAERIFNVFTRLHGITEYKGTGIGLSIVRKVIENHNGYIWAIAKPGVGATFNVLLPANNE